MPRKNLVLTEKFNEFFLEPEGFSLRAQRFHEAVAEANPETMRQWLQAAFEQGAKVVAKDTLEVLSDFAAATAGLSETRTPSDGYDSAAESLSEHYARVIPKM